MSAWMFLTFAIALIAVGAVGLRLTTTTST